MFEKDEAEEILQAARLTSNLTKEVIRNCDDEFYELNASHWWKMYQAAIAQGFLPMQALELVKASMRSISK